LFGFCNQSGNNGAKDYKPDKVFALSVIMGASEWNNNELKKVVS